MTTATGATARDPGRETSPWPALSPQERGERGRAARREVPRSVHAAWAPAPDRRAPVDILQEQSADRPPDLVPVRYGRMLESPFAFFRGAAAIMAPDLAHTPVSGLHAQLCGDAHVANFGGFASPERELVFDVNDFDETAKGPWEWDVKRLAASLEVAGREHQVSSSGRNQIVRRAMRSYRETMREFAAVPMLTVWYAGLDMGVLLPRFRSLDATKTPAVWKAITKARARDSHQA